MTDLIERLERADGPSRELDWAIHALIMPKHHRMHPYLVGVFIDDGQLGKVYSCPRYTASIDAAITLVPEGFRWALGYNGIDSGHPVGTASVFSPAGAMFKGSGATPALALCVAALRAKEADNGQV